MTPRRVALGCVGLGAFLVVLGCGLVFPPAALVVGGLLLLAAGLEDLVRGRS